MGLLVNLPRFFFSFTRTVLLVLIGSGLLFNTWSSAATVEVVEDTEAGTESTTPTIEQMQKMVDEWETKQKAELLVASPTTKRFHEVLDELQSVKAKDFRAFVQRMLAVAESDPEDAGAREALMWVVSSGMPSSHPEIKQQAISKLLENHVNDPETPRATLMFRTPSANYDELLAGMVQGATDHETLGLAKLAFARYLIFKASGCEHWQNQKEAGDSNVAGFLEDKEYVASLLTCDFTTILKESELLLEDVSENYDDVPYFRSGRFNVLDLIEKQSLADVAKNHLDEIRNRISIGKAAPEIEGMDLNDQPLKLSDYRGKVVVVVFWASWCGPCMAEVPHEREIVERFSDKPFAFLGVNCDVDREAALKTAEAAQIPWRNWYDGFPAPVPGPIVKRYHTHSLPAVFVLDAKGIVRAKHLRGEKLEERIAELLNEIEADE